MAIQTSDVRISNLSLLTKRAAGGGRYRVTATLSLASGDIYGTDHRIPVDKAALGLPTSIEHMDIMSDGGSGYIPRFNPGLDDILLFVPRLITGGATMDVGFNTTQDAVRLLGPGRAYSGMMSIITNDSGSATAVNSTFRLPSLIELASGDILLGTTFDIVAIGF